MQVKKLIDIIDSDFYTGVPDSQLKALCNYLMNTYGIDPKHHLIAANEGNCAALAALPDIIWQPGKFRSCICRTAGRAILLILRRPC